MSTAEFAASIALEIDRIRIAIAQKANALLGAQTTEIGVSESAGVLLSMLRNLPPDRKVEHAAVHALFPYQPPEMTANAVSDLESAAVVLVAGDEIGLTAKGIEAIERLFYSIVAVVDQVWGGVEADFAGLQALTNKAIAAGARTGGLTFRVLWPVYEREDTPARVGLAENLTPLRFHRFDAHVAAWQAAGLSAAEIQGLEDESLKEQIEAETNARAAAPYEALSAVERTQLLDGLRSLPTP